MTSVTQVNPLETAIASGSGLEDSHCLSMSSLVLVYHRHLTASGQSYNLLQSTCTSLLCLSFSECDHVVSVPVLFCGVLSKLSEGTPTRVTLEHSKRVGMCVPGPSHRHGIKVTASCSDDVIYRVK